MPRRHDPINDFFNELLDATVTTLIDTMRPEFRKLAKSAVEQAKAKADAKAENTNTKRRTKRRTTTGQEPPPYSPPSRRPTHTLYDVLEVSPYASDETIQVAYRSLATKYHPDKPTGDAVRMRMINDARDTLTDPYKRKVYNRSIGLHG